MTKVFSMSAVRLHPRQSLPKEPGRCQRASQLAHLLGLCPGPNSHCQRLVRRRELRRGLGHMIEPSPQGAKTGLDVPKTLSVSKLSKSHTQELVPARKGSNSIVARIAFYACSEFVPGKKIHQLGENGSALIHNKSSALWQKHVPEPVTENSNRFLPKSQATLWV